MIVMRIKQLEYLEAVIQTGSINEAAKKLYLTKPLQYRPSTMPL